LANPLRATMVMVVCLRLMGEGSLAVRLAVGDGGDAVFSTLPHYLHTSGIVDRHEKRLILALPLSPSFSLSSADHHHHPSSTMPDSRWTQQGVRHAYATKSNRRRAVRTPGGKLTSQLICKKSTGVKCSDCKMALPGIPHLKATMYRRTVKRVRTVSRAYGGSACHSCVKERIMRAFLLEEQKAVKKLMAETPPPPAAAPAVAAAAVTK
jgi:large subunit ribosomal protein L34e